jgi:hypothetical protein
MTLSLIEIIITPVYTVTYIIFCLIYHEHTYNDRVHGRKKYCNMSTNSNKILQQQQQPQHTLQETKAPIINILSSESPLIKYHQQRYILEREKKLNASRKACMNHIKMQKAAYKRLYPSLQRTSVVLQLMKTIKKLEEDDYARVLPSNNLTQFIPEHFSSRGGITNVSQSSILTNFKRENVENNYGYSHQKPEEDKNIKYKQKNGLKASPILIKYSNQPLRQRQLIPLEHESITQPSARTTTKIIQMPSPPSKIQASRNDNLHIANTKRKRFMRRGRLRTTQQQYATSKSNNRSNRNFNISNQLLEKNNLQTPSTQCVLPFILSNGIRVKRSREIIRSPKAKFAFI